MINSAGRHGQCSLDIKVAVTEMSYWALGKAKNKVGDLAVAVSEMYSWAEGKAKSKAADYPDVLRWSQVFYFYSSCKTI